MQPDAVLVRPLLSSAVDLAVTTIEFLNAVRLVIEMGSML